MKKLLLFVIACTLGLFGTVSAQETITIGNEEEVIRTYSVPFDLYNGYGVCQQLYTADEIGKTAGAIESLALKFVGPTNSDMQTPANQDQVVVDFEIYVENTTMTTLSSFQVVETGDLYFSGKQPMENDAWTTFEFSNSFEYDGTNLLITIYCVGDKYEMKTDNNYYPFYAYTTNDVQCLSASPQDKPIAGVSFSGLNENSGKSILQLTFSAAGEGGEEPTPEPEPTPTIPSHPASMTATANGQNSITLTWEAVEGATSYNIYSTAAGNVPAVTATEYTYEGLTAGTYYCFEITAENAAGESYDSAYGCATTEAATEEPPPEPEPTPTIPSHPASMTATANGQNSITLTWEAVEGATSYNIYSTAAGNVPAVTATEYTYEGLTAGTQYCFEVTAENAVGESYDAAYACATTEEAPVAPAAPTNVVATVDGQNSIVVTWAAVEGATYYIVYKDGQMWDQVNGTTYTSTGLTAGTEYCYAVQAYDANGLESELSEEVCETTEAAIEIPEGATWSCSVEFVLGDSYNDGWNGNNLYVSYGDVTEKLTLTGGGSTIYVLDIPKGSHVTVTYKPEGSYQSENTFGVRYYGDTEYICTQYTINNKQTYTHEFDVNCEPSMPSVPALTATATGGSTIVLAIEGAGAESYNIYEGGELFAEGVTGNTYTAENLDPETEYCFTAQLLTSSALQTLQKKLALQH